MKKFQFSNRILVVISIEFYLFPFQIILILGFAALAAAKTPTLSLHNSLEPPLDYIPVNSGADIQSSKIPSGSKPDSTFPGPGYLHPLCPNGNPPPCDKAPEPTCPNGSKPPCENKTPEQKCPNGRPPPCTCPPPLIGTPPNCRGSPYIPIVRPVLPQCPR